MHIYLRNNDNQMSFKISQTVSDWLGVPQDYYNAQKLGNVIMDPWYLSIFMNTHYCLVIKFLKKNLVDKL